MSLDPWPAFLRQTEFTAFGMDQPIASCSTFGNVSGQQPTSKSSRRRFKKKKMVGLKKINAIMIKKALNFTVKMLK